jgi:Transposase, Mutator family
VQTCVLHLVRNTFRYASKADWYELARDLRPVYTTREQHQLDKQLAAQAELAYRRLVQDWQPAIKGAGAAPGRASCGPSSGQAARQETAPPPAL